MAKKSEQPATNPGLRVEFDSKITDTARKLANYSGRGRVPFEVRLAELGNVDAIAAMIESGDIDDALAVLDDRPPAKDSKAN